MVPYACSQICPAATGTGAVVQLGAVVSGKVAEIGSNHDTPTVTSIIGSSPGW